MCVIYACASAIPEYDELSRGYSTNRDGAGVAWLEDGKLHFSKGMKDHDEVLKVIETEKIAPPLAIHFRTASVGGVNPELCHPFPVWKGAPTWLAGTASTVLFHNGHLTSWEELALKLGLAAREEFPEGPWSDSRVLAWAAHLKGPGILPFLVGGSRILLFNLQPSTPKDEEYDPTRDHFIFYGAGWIHKEKYSQSINTIARYETQKSRGGAIVHITRGAWEDDWETNSPSESVTTNEYTTPNIFTVSELREHLERIEKEQTDAKFASPTP